MSEAWGSLGRISSYKRVFPSVSLVLVVLLASWMDNANGGYLGGDLSLVAFFLAVMLLAVSAVGMLTKDTAASDPRTIELSHPAFGTP
jgi:hypothetical protein